MIDDVSRLVDYLTQADDISLNYFDINIKLSVNINYSVKRLMVLAQAGNTDVVTRRIFVTDTLLRHIAMHIADYVCQHHVQSDIDWHEILDDLNDILNPKG